MGACLGHSILLRRQSVLLCNMAHMDEAALRQLCRDQKLYATPHLNDSLFAGNQGFLSLGGLEAYTGLRALHLEGNALETLEGLPPLPGLLCL